MVIQHNIMALNAHRQLGGNNTMVSKNLEKLSSGYKINRAGDDAAGLAISEKMRAQITGLNRAQANAQDGISLVQTAEGALTEVHSMLNRMVDLSTQSSNGTYQDSDRQKIQDEINALSEEIDRISQATNFNGINLLDGSLAGGKGSGGTGSNDIGNVVVSGAGTLTNAGAQAGQYSTILGGATLDAGKQTFSIELSDGTTKTVEFNITATTDAVGTKSAIEKAFADDAYFKENFNVTFDSTTKELAFAAKKEGAQVPSVKKVDIYHNTLTVANAIGAGTTASNTNIYTRSGIATAGSSTAVTGAEVRVETTVKAQDAYKQIHLGGTNDEIAANSSIKVGDKIYKFVKSVDQYKVGADEVAVVLGNNRNDTVESFVAALQANGVKSAQVDGINVKVNDVNELKSKQGYDIKASNANGVDIGGGVNVNAEYEVAFVGTTTGAANISFDYTDKDNKTYKMSVEVVGSGTNVAAINLANVVKELNKDEKFSALFEAKANTAGDKIILTAKNNISGVKLTGVSADDTDVIAANTPVTNNVKAFGAGQTISLDPSKLMAGDTVTVNGKTFEFTTADKVNDVKKGNTAVLIGADKQSSANNLIAALKTQGMDAKLSDLKTDGTNADFKVLIEYDGTSMNSGGGLTLQIGDTSDEFNQVTVGVEDMSTKGLNIQDIKVEKQGVSKDTIDKIKGAIEKVSTTRGNLGALQNRLEHTINNLGVTAENMTAAESRVRDVDMAKEMMMFTKNNVLTQAAQAMLAQANQQPQQILQLLR